MRYDPLAKKKFEQCIMRTYFVGKRNELFSRGHALLNAFADASWIASHVSYDFQQLALFLLLLLLAMIGLVRSRVLGKWNLAKENSRKFCRLFVSLNIEVICEKDKYADAAKYLSVKELLWNYKVKNVRLRCSAVRRAQVYICLRWISIMVHLST